MKSGKKIAIGFSVISIESIGNYESSLQHEFNPKISNKVLPNLFIIDIYKQQVDNSREKYCWNQWLF